MVLEIKINMLKRIHNPDIYHGNRRKKNFFEGWYFKLVDRWGKESLAFIPGIYKGEDKGKSHSFIQVLQGNKCSYNYIKYKEEDFIYSKNKFNIAIRKNLFSLNSINIDLQFKDLYVKGVLRFKNIKKWPDTFINPGSMGFYNYFTFMECYSQVCALNGEVQGYLEVNGEEIDFNLGKVYIEKNWGREFPNSWIWIQSNSFKEKNVSITCSIGRVPFIFGSFSGFLVGITLENRFYSFTSINKSRMDFKIRGRDVIITFLRGNLLLTIETFSDNKEFMLCMGPKGKSMIPLVYETLKGRVVMELKNIKTNEIIYKGEGKAAGIEYGGEFMDNYKL
ncbi:tocopherol cyclase family protein [Clostridium hydrogeniformans]|uniref:tocopherol cyclase family protein n=1 Tax=Clostridium hydrogeniformans TaxID=349933 RepID=UPI000AE30010|nr:tocopherol cyclase family protein [Clostridium hydrogeniformans]